VVNSRLRFKKIFYLCENNRSEVATSLSGKTLYQQEEKPRKSENEQLEG
jgi:hypothetical protein